MNLKNTILCIGILALVGCTTMKESLLLGTLTGALTGAVINNTVDRDNSNAANNGALVGAIIGLTSSYFIHESLEKRDSRIRRETLLNLDRFNVSHPTTDLEDDNYFVSSPRVETQCFDSDIKGNKLIEAHCESVIVDRPEWIKKQKKVLQNKKYE